jgi:Zn-dependent protease with chaperone function
VEPAASERTVDLAQLDDARLSQYRHPAERWALLAIAVGAAILLSALWVARTHFGDNLAFLPGPLVQIFVHWTHPTRMGLVILVALVATWAADVIGQSVKAWQLVARAVVITPSTFPQFAPVVDELRARFDLPRITVYISREAPPAGYTVGVREPYAIVLSAPTVGLLTPDEFKFILGRQMGHIKLGHIWVTTVLGSAGLRLPAPLSYLLNLRTVLFGSYQHAQELSCDRIGVVATRDVGPALSALIKQDLGSVRGAQIDIETLGPQSDALRGSVSAASLKIVQKMSAQPFVVSRLLELIEWVGPPEATLAVASLAAPGAMSPLPATCEPGAAAA